MRWATMMLSMLSGVIAVLSPYPVSLVFAMVSVGLLFYNISIPAMITGVILAGIIAAIPLAFDYAIGHLPWHLMISNTMGGRFSFDDERIPKEYITAMEDEYLQGIKRLEINGANIEVSISEAASLVHIEKGLHYSVRGNLIEVFSKEKGLVETGNLEKIFINGMKVKVYGRGEIGEVEINGLGNELKISLIRNCEIEINGLSNDLDIFLEGSTDFSLYIAGVSNNVKVDATKMRNGKITVDVTGMGNGVKILLAKRSTVDVNVRKIHMNDVEVVRR